MRLGIRAKLLFSLIAILTIPYLVLFTIAQNFVEEQLRTEVSNFQTEKAQNVAGDIRDFLFATASRLNGISRAYAEASNDRLRIETITSYTVSVNNFLFKVTILSPTGRELFKRDRLRVWSAEDLSFEILSKPFNQAVKGEMGVSKVFFSEKQNLPFVEIFVPVFSKAQVVGVVKGEVGLEALGEIIGKAEYGASGMVYVVDEEGRLIGHPEFEKVLEGPNLSSRRIVSALLAGTEETLSPRDHFYLNLEGREVFANGVKIGDLGWVVVVHEEAGAAFSAISKTRNTTFFLALVSLGLTLFLVVPLGYSFTRPIALLKRGSDRLRGGDLSTRVEVKTGDELEDLSSSFNQMATQLQELFASVTQEKERFQALVRSIGEGVFAIDRDAKVIFANDALEEISGFSEAGLKGKVYANSLKFVDEEGREARGFVDDALFEGKSGSLAYNYFLLDYKQRRVPIFANAAPIKDEAGKIRGAIVVLRDTSSEYQLELRKREVIDIVSHELRTPLTAMRGFSELLLEKRLTARQKDLVEGIDQGAKRLIKLVDDMLNLSRLEQGVVKFSLTDFDIVELCQKVAERFLPEVKTKGLKLEVIPAKKALPRVSADPGRADEILDNLLSNALKFTEKGGARLSFRALGNFVEVTVSDTGVGISKKEQGFLFEKFHQVGRTKVPNVQGTGLGLYISRLLARKMGGELWLSTSEVGKGTTFTFNLPILGSPEAEAVKKIVSEEEKMRFLMRWNVQRS